MQLTGQEIKHRMQGPNPQIVIEPYDRICLGTNSYDLHLAPLLRVYKNTIPKGMNPTIDYKKYLETPEKLRMRLLFTNYIYYVVYSLRRKKYDYRNPDFLINPFEQQDTIDIKIPETGLILSPQFLYLGETIEYTETHGNLFPQIDGKSSVGRNGISIHQTAGRGDSGFCGHWTLEITVQHATLILPGMRIGQIYFEESYGSTEQYGDVPTSHYQNQSGPTPASPIIVDPFIQEYLAQQGAQRGK